MLPLIDSLVTFHEFNLTKINETFFKSLKGRRKTRTRIHVLADNNSKPKQINKRNDDEVNVSFSPIYFD